MTTVRHEAPPYDFGAYAAVPIAFQVERALTRAPDLGPLAFREETLVVPWLKDYDSEPGAHPTSWPSRFDTAPWHLFTAHQGTDHVGGLVLILGSPEIDMLEGRSDLALIWDLRVAPEARGSGVGLALLREAEALALTLDALSSRSRLRTSTWALVASTREPDSSSGPSTIPRIPNSLTRSRCFGTRTF